MIALQNGLFYTDNVIHQIIMFGVVICLDSFLYTFTILPLRIIAALSHLVKNVYHNTFSGSRPRHLRLAHKCDLTKALILAGTLFVLHHITDASKMYHSVRGQETVKLYVIFNVLEVNVFAFEDLSTSLTAGHPIADRGPPLLLVRAGFAGLAFLSADLWSQTRWNTTPYPPRCAFRFEHGLRRCASSVVCSAAVFSLRSFAVAHTLVLFYQLVTLNVAINSFSNALITLLLSNQFVEIKGSVFKKFEKENLFQLTCAGAPTLHSSFFLFCLIPRFPPRYRRAISARPHALHHRPPKLDRALLRLVHVLHLLLPPFLLLPPIPRPPPKSLQPSNHRPPERVPRRLAQARLHHQVQPHPTCRLRAVHRRLMQRPRRRCRPTPRPSKSLLTPFPPLSLPLTTLS